MLASSSAKRKKTGCAVDAAWLYNGRVYHSMAAESPHHADVGLIAFAHGALYRRDPRQDTSHKYDVGTPSKSRRIQSDRKFELS